MSALTLDRLATLAPRSSFAAPMGIPPKGYGSVCVSGNTLAWSTPWEEGPELLLIDLATGTLLHREPELAVGRMWRHQEGFLVYDSGYRLGCSEEDESEACRLMYLSPNCKTIETFEAPAGSIKSFSPDRTEVAIFNEGRLEIRQWPSLSLKFTQTGYRPGVDWDARRTFCFDGRQYKVLSIDGDSPPHFIDTDSGRLYPLGSGIAETGVDELTLFSLLSDWRLTLAPRGGDGIASPQLTADRRGIRVVLGGKPRRVDIDFATGRLMSETIEPAPRVQASDQYAWWHPTLDAVVHERHGKLQLSTLKGDVLCRLPAGARPECWFDQGRALLVTYPNSNPDRLRMEVWRVS